MLTLDFVTIALLLLALSIIFSNSRDIKRMLSEASYERMDLHRRLEAIVRRLERLERKEKAEEENEAA